MADYVSALNGQQMDAALMDMALHNSEAWAVGTRNGYEVESDDITWENNAKYYASVAGESSTTATTAASSASESASTASSAATAAASDATRAEDAADRAEAIVGGQFVSYGQTQGLTDAQKLQARANISAGASNRNLLDNPWWGSGEVVNQRGVSSGTAPSFQYTIDRWKMNPSSSVTYSIGAGGITFTVPSAGYIQMIQYFLNPAILNGKTLTASVLLSNGTIQSGTISRTNGTAQIFFNTGSLAALLQTDNTFRVTAYATQTIRAVKLELGSYSTLANDVPPDYESEKRKCMAYFQRIRINTNYNSAIGFGFIVNNVRVFIPLAVPLRGSTFSVSATNTGGMSLIGNGTNAVVTAVSPLAIANHGGVVVDVATSTTLTGNQIYLFRFINNTAYLDISADL